MKAAVIRTDTSRRVARRLLPLTATYHLPPLRRRGGIAPFSCERIEGTCKDALERLHPPIRQRLEGKRFLPAWGDFTRNETIGIVSAALTGLGIVAAVAIALVWAA